MREMIDKQPRNPYHEDMKTTRTISGVELDRIRYANVFRKGSSRKEIWSAETVDGNWVIERVEATGTPWVIYYKPAREEFSSHFATIDEACATIAKIYSGEWELVLFERPDRGPYLTIRTQDGFIPGPQNRDGWWGVEIPKSFPDSKVGA